MRIPRVNLYLSDELAAAVRPLGLNLSNVLQVALRERLESQRLQVWLAALESHRPAGADHRASLSALDVSLGGSDRG